MGPMPPGLDTVWVHASHCAMVSKTTDTGELYPPCCVCPHHAQMLHCPSTVVYCTVCVDNPSSARSHCDPQCRLGGSHIMCAMIWGTQCPISWHSYATVPISCVPHIPHPQVPQCPPISCCAWRLPLAAALHCSSRYADNNPSSSTAPHVCSQPELLRLQAAPHFPKERAGWDPKTGEKKGSLESPFPVTLLWLWLQHQ